MLSGKSEMPATQVNGLATILLLALQMSMPVLYMTAKLMITV
jgi:hypothetical protein